MAPVKSLDSETEKKGKITLANLQKWEKKIATVEETSDFLSIVEVKNWKECMLINAKSLEEYGIFKLWD